MFNWWGSPHKPISLIALVICVIMSVITRFPPDPTMTVDAVTQVMDKINGDKSHVMMVGLLLPEPLVYEIWQSKYSSSSEESHVIASAYVNTDTNPSWDNLTNGLYNCKEFAAARTSKTFMSTGKYCHYITY